MVGDTVQLAKMARSSIDKVKDKLYTLTPVRVIITIASRQYYCWLFGHFMGSQGFSATV